MHHMTLWKNISDQIASHVGTSFHCDTPQACGGGCINDAYVLRDDTQRYFVKLNQPHLLHMFEAEAEGLTEIAKSQSIRVPKVICVGQCSGKAFLVLEFLEMGCGNAQSERQLGTDLAQMHRYQHRQFGWHRDNTIGSTAQRNTQHDDWVEFWRNERLSFQLELAAQNGAGKRLASLGEQLLLNLDAFFVDYRPVPSLLHGDLWSGNFAFCSDGTPVIFDPATYFGDREADLAMTELFGGFSHNFYAAYKERYPLNAGYPQRKTLYNLYHIINHFNLFGGGYLNQAESMLAQLVSEVR